FKIEIVIENVTEKEANEKEVELILYYGRRDLGTGTLVNMTNGGEGTCGRTVSKETRKKISDSNRGKVRSEEARKKMCGKIHTE
ncbi:NUMOD3 domain-containing DNA-binding protein, partial [Burkholderia pseudomallei]